MIRPEAPVTTGRHASPAIRPAGFSLVELLVVVAILSVLVTILIPSLQGVKRLARIAVCVSTLGQLNRALDQYTTVYDQKYWLFTHASGHYWYDKISPYHNDMDAARFCPEAKQVSPTGWGSATLAWGPREGKCGSYGLNLWLTPNDPGTMAAPSPYYAQFLPWQDDFWGSPTMTRGPVPTFCDSSWVGSWPFDTDPPPEDLSVGDSIHQPGPGSRFMGRFCLDRHGFSVCVGFTNGSARRVRLPELWEMQWSRHYEPCEITIPEP